MIPKSKFGPGPWQDEPDRVQFNHAGFVCLIRRAPLGHLCGYVGVAPGHPWHGNHDVDEVAYAHGGVNYAEPCAGEICHVPEPGEPEHLFWVGFDCAHYTDISPGTEAARSELGLGPTPAFGAPPVYRDLAYVRAETERLAEQAARAALDAERGLTQTSQV